MAITYKDLTFDVVDNGDGTYTLTPQSPASATELIKEYRKLRDRITALIEHRIQIVARIDEMRTRRDEIKLLLETSGETPDDDINP